MDSKIEMSKPETNVTIVFDLSPLIKVVVSAVVIVAVRRIVLNFGPEKCLKESRVTCGVSSKRQVWSTFFLFEFFDHVSKGKFGPHSNSSKRQVWSKIRRKILDQTCLFEQFESGPNLPFDTWSPSYNLQPLNLINLTLTLDPDSNHSYFSCSRRKITIHSVIFFNLIGFWKCMTHKHLCHTLGKLFHEQKDKSDKLSNFWRKRQNLKGIHRLGPE